MQQTVTVKEVKSNGKAVVQMQRLSACGHSCEGCHGCGAPNVIISVDAINKPGAEKGDRVVVESGNKALYKAAFVVYLIPIILFFALYAIGWKLADMGALFGIIGFAIGVGAAVLFNRKFTKDGGVQFTIVSIVERHC